MSRGNLGRTLANILAEGAMFRRYGEIQMRAFGHHIFTSLLTSLSRHKQVIATFCQIYFHL